MVIVIPKVDQLIQWELKCPTTMIAGNRALVSTSQTSLQSKVIQRLVALEVETDQILPLANKDLDQAHTTRITGIRTLLGIQSAMVNAKQLKTLVTQALASTISHILWLMCPAIKCLIRMTNGDLSESSSLYSYLSINIKDSKELIIN